MRLRFVLALIHKCTLIAIYIVLLAWHEWKIYTFNYYLKTSIKKKMAINLLVIILLTFNGLVYCPRFVQALQCYRCTKEDAICTGENEIEEICNPGLDGCLIEKVSTVLRKGCTKRIAIFDCVQKRLGQNGDCVRGIWDDVQKHALDCLIEEQTKDLQINIENMVKYFATINVSRQSFEPRSEQEYLDSCICATNFCNIEDLLDGGNYSVSTTPQNGGGILPSTKEDTSPRTDATSSTTKDEGDGDDVTSPITTPAKGDGNELGNGATLQKVASSVVIACGLIFILYL